MKVGKKYIGTYPEIFCGVCGNRLEYSEWTDQNHVWMSCPIFMVGNDRHDSFLCEIENDEEGEKIGMRPNEK